MDKKEIDTILSMKNAAIIAPAGHGKTEMIVDIVSNATGKQLLLTHTNAGVEALKKRLNKKHVSSQKYVIQTIAGFCIKWCNAFYSTAKFNKLLDPYSESKKTRNQYYQSLYPGAQNIFSQNWALDILGHTYSHVIVDEYQDCTEEQHKIFLKINQKLQVIVFGDPLQGIFDFAGPMVDWSNLTFKTVDVATRPWRWENTNKALGVYLERVRTSLQPILQGKPSSITISNFPFVKIISPDTDDYRKVCYGALRKYSSVVFLAEFENKQIGFSQRILGYQNDETQECLTLYKFAKFMDELSGNKLALKIFEFIAICATKVSTEFSTYISKLNNNNQDFSHIKKHVDIQPLLLALCCEKNHANIINVLKWFESNRGLFRFYRIELFNEMLRSLILAKEEKRTVAEAACIIRNNPKYQHRYSNFKHLSSRTLLSKGLEFECVIIDLGEKPDAKNFYVAMTRATKMIYIISHTNRFAFDK